MNTAAAGTAIFDDLSTLADAMRSRMLLVLDRNELTVTELCAVMQLPQSTVSRHLKTLLDAGWVHSRREGTSRFYTLSIDHREPSVRRLWTLLREQVASSPAADQDARRLKSVVASRQSKSQEFFESAAGQWDKMRQELFGPASHLHAMLGLLDPAWSVGDLGCGTGQLASAIAPFVRQVIAVDRSGEMLQAARRRLREYPNVEVRRGDLEALPISDGVLDAALVMLVLHHVPDPAATLREAARVLRPGGRLVICDMLRHDREEYRQQMGHVWLGFDGSQIDEMLRAAGFESRRVVSLPTGHDTKGPALFISTGISGRNHQPAES